ncbi:MAG TPA: ABC transporter substrate-binding protein [Actinomycetota bacterium]|nr:ABC transporter substrate-binding protein [Actinomycetota bacterium]
MAIVVTACETAAPAAPGPVASPAASPASTSQSASPVATPSPAPPRPAVAFLQDLSPEGALEPLLPVYRAVELALAAVSLDPEEPLEVELVAFDTAGDPDVAAEIAAQIAEDPRFVAAMASPELPGQSHLMARLSRDGVPVLSLSGRGSPQGAPDGAWLRFVAPVRTLAGVLAGTAGALRRADDGICLVRAPSDGTVLGRVARTTLLPTHEVTEVDGADEVHGCGVVLWAGGALDGAELAAALSSRPHPPVLVGGPALRDPRFLTLAGDAQAVAVCSCVDLSTSLELEAQRFIQDFQTEYGRPPGPYVVEAWDAARLLLAAMRDGGPTRSAVWGRIAGLGALDGLGGPYRFEDGELADPASFVRVYRVRGGRWLEVAAPRNA